MRELYVYYRIAGADAPRCEAVVLAFQARMAREVPRLRARLLARPASVDGEETWMETYALDGGIDAALEARIEAAAGALAPHLRGPRHVEVFIARS